MARLTFIAMPFRFLLRLRQSSRHFPYEAADASFERRVGKMTVGVKAIQHFRPIMPVTAMRARSLIMKHSKFCISQEKCYGYYFSIKCLRQPIESCRRQSLHAKTSTRRAKQNNTTIFTTRDEGAGALKKQDATACARMLSLSSIIASQAKIRHGPYDSLRARERQQYSASYSRAT